MINSVETYKAEIYIGFREQYSDVYHTYEELVDICKEYCNEVGLCVSIDKLDFIYTNGGEPGARVTLINYPRFPATSKNIALKAVTLAGRLQEAFKQYRTSVVCADHTYMIENDELIAEEEKKQ